MGFSTLLLGEGAAVEIVHEIRRWDRDRASRMQPDVLRLSREERVRGGLLLRVSKGA